MDTLYSVSNALVLHFPYAGLFALLILGGIGLPFPEDATLILTGVLIATDVVKPYLAVPTVYAGTLVADVVLYAFGRKYGRQVVMHKRFHKILPRDKISAIETWFKRWDILVIVVGRHLVGLRAQILLVSGVLRMSAIKFILADAFSSAFTVAVMVFIGYKGGESIQVLKRNVTRIEHIAVVAVVAAIFLLIFYWYFKPQRTKSRT